MTKNKEDISYIKMEKPVVIFDLENPIRNETDFYEAIADTSYRMTDIGIYNLVIKVDQKNNIFHLLQKLNKDKNLQCIVRNKSSSLFSVDKIVLKQSNMIYCEEIGNICEIDYHKRPITNPIIVQATDRNYLQLMEFIANLGAKSQNTIIISAVINVATTSNFDTISWAHMDELYCFVIDIQKRFPKLPILMDYGILPLRLLTEHPCNGYVCSHETCHSYKNNLPRRLFIDGTGEVLPEHPRMPYDFSLGNIYSTDIISILESFKNSPRQKNFLTLAKSVYINWVETCPYRVVPWSELMLKMALAENRGNI